MFFSIARFCTCGAASTFRSCTRFPSTVLIFCFFITNAIAHTKEDTTIEIFCNLLKNNVVEIGVHDYGQGIAEKDLPRIFERFYRADPSRTTNGHYGLGLSVAKSLAEQQSLHIGARNTPGGGAMFYICTQ